MVAIERRAVVLALVAEQLTEAIDVAGAVDQQHPVVVAALVPQMPEHRTVGLRHRLALALALDRVRLADGRW